MIYFIQGKNFKFFLISFLILFCFSEEIKAFSSYDNKEKNDFSFACSLFKEGDYYRAISEFKRALYFSEDEKLNPIIRYNIGICYQKANRLNEAFQTFYKLSEDYPDSEIAKKSKIHLGLVSFMAGNYITAINQLKEFEKKYNEDKTVVYLLAFSYLNEKDWKTSSQYFTRLQERFPDSKYTKKTKDFNKEILKGEKLHRKSPVLAMILSSLIPGAGQIYCDRYKDGVLAFLYNSILFYTTYYSYTLNKEKNNTSTYVWFSIAGIFYIANIYGAISSAQNANLIIESNFISGFMKNFSIEEEGLIEQVP
jgi:outer membrane protein assembly factor BamD (BamD/ComL family)/TM2 domain-containing membrane protein YozV